MKKRVIALSFIVSMTIIYAGSLDYIVSGEYAFYNDSRGDMNYLRGYWLFRMEQDQYVVFSRNVDLNTGRETNFYFVLKDDEEGKPEVVGIKGLGKGASPEVQQAIPDFLNYTYLYLNHKYEIEFDTTIEDPWENYVLLFRFNSLLPFFRFLNIKNTNDDEPRYKLESAGMLEHSKADVFLNYKGKKLEEKKRKIKDLTIHVAADMGVDINGYKTVLDENWKYNDSMGSPGYWLKGSGYRESQITVEQMPESFSMDKSLDMIGLARLSIINLEGSVYFDSIKAEKRENTLIVFYALLDGKHIKNYQYFMITEKEGKVFVINFSTFADIFDANQDYYKRILSPFMQD